MMARNSQMDIYLKKIDHSLLWSQGSMTRLIVVWLKIINSPQKYEKVIGIVFNIKDLGFLGYSFFLVSILMVYSMKSYECSISAMFIDCFWPRNCKLASSTASPSSMDYACISNEGSGLQRLLRLVARQFSIKLDLNQKQ